MRLAKPNVKFLEFPEYTGNVYACDNHPSADLHMRMVTQLATQVKKDLSW